MIFAITLLDHPKSITNYEKNAYIPNKLVSLKLILKLQTKMGIKRNISNTNK